MKINQEGLESFGTENTVGNRFQSTSKELTYDDTTALDRLKISAAYQFQLLPTRLQVHINWIMPLKLSKMCNSGVNTLGCLEVLMALKLGLIVVCDGNVKSPEIPRVGAKEVVESGSSVDLGAVVVEAKPVWCSPVEWNTGICSPFRRNASYYSSYP
ncbi:hypothetical protein HAX54_029584 [Datura stramonium]|uniref:Uncharacterized protein n=1 Tax=Datura stramonium TaxID=4076 RepID=A0ABS8V6T5_DATST|nr:hypothetical protein [Datura stramonium]